MPAERIDLEVVQVSSRTDAAVVVFVVPAATAEVAIDLAATIVLSAAVPQDNS